jgi:predicted transglutaminase-like cysteine proteinase
MTPRQGAGAGVKLQAPPHLFSAGRNPPVLVARKQRHVFATSSAAMLPSSGLLLFGAGMIGAANDSAGNIEVEGMFLDVRMAVRRQFRRPATLAVLLAALQLWSLPVAAGVTNSVFISTKSAINPPSGAVDLCQRYAWACQASGQGKLSSASALLLAKKVNRSVNQSVQSISDSAQYGAQEVWTLPSRRGGDCEDYALLKKHELINRGLPAQRLLLATVFGKRTGSHTVLILRLDEGDYVLDNMTDEIKSWTKTKYTFLRIQDPESPDRWRNVVVGN